MYKGMEIKKFVSINPSEVTTAMSLHADISYTIPNITTGTRNFLLIFSQAKKYFACQK